MKCNVVSLGQWSELISAPGIRRKWSNTLDDSGKQLL